MWEFAKEAYTENGIELVTLGRVSEQEVVLLARLIEEMNLIDEFCVLKANFDFD